MPSMQSLDHTCGVGRVEYVDGSADLQLKSLGAIRKVPEAIIIGVCRVIRLFCFWRLVANGQMTAY